MSNSKANDRQVGGDHYKTGGLQHWDLIEIFNLGYFEGNISKYVFRWRKKNGIEDLKKARHYLDKLIEIEEKRVNDLLRAKSEFQAAQDMQSAIAEFERSIGIDSRALGHGSECAKILGAELTCTCGYDKERDGSDYTAEEPDAKQPELLAVAGSVHTAACHKRARGPGWACTCKGAVDATAHCG